MPGLTVALLIGPVFVGSIVVHELLHALAAMMAGGLRWADIRFGVNWPTLTRHAGVEADAGPSDARGMPGRSR